MGYSLESIASQSPIFQLFPRHVGRQRRVHRQAELGFLLKHPQYHLEPFGVGHLLQPGLLHRIAALDQNRGELKLLFPPRIRLESDGLDLLQPDSRGWASEQTTILDRTFIGELKFSDVVVHPEEKVRNHDHDGRGEEPDRSEKLEPSDEDREDPHGHQTRQQDNVRLDPTRSNRENSGLLYPLDGCPFFALMSGQPAEPCEKAREPKR